MKKLIAFLKVHLRWGLTFAAWGSYILLFAIIQDRVGPVVAALSILPVVVMSWYFGLTGASLSVAIAILINAIILMTFFEYTPLYAFTTGGLLFGDAMLTLIAFVIGYLSQLTRQLKQVILERDTLEKDRQEYADFLSQLNEISISTLESQDLSIVLDKLTNQIGKMFRAKDCFIVLWDEARKKSNPIVAYGAKVNAFLDSGGHAIAYSVMESGNVLAIEDASKSALVTLPADKRALLGLPLIAGKSKLGAIILGYRKHQSFTQDKIARGEMAAQHISLALDKGLSLESAEQNVQELTGLHEISKTFNSPKQVKNVYGSLVERLGKLVGGQMCVICLPESPGGEFRAQQPGFGVKDKLLTAFHFPLQAMVEVTDFSDRKAVVLSKNGDQSPPEIQKILRHFKLKTAIVAPMHIENELVGFLMAGNKPRGFSDEDARMFGVLAGQAAAVIHGAHLFKKEQKQAKLQSALFQMSTELATRLEEEEIYEQVVNRIHETLEYDNVGLLIIDETTGKRIPVSGVGWPDGIPDEPLSPGQGLSERPVLDGKLHYSPDVTNEPGYIPGAGGSEIDVPIRINDVVSAVLVIENKNKNAFNQDDFDILTAAANITGLALTRSKLFSSERKQFEELATLHAIAMAVTEATNEDQLIERATMIIGEKLFPDNFGFLLVDEGVGGLRMHPSYSIHKKPSKIDQVVPFGKGVVGHVASTGLLERIADVALSPHYLNIDSGTRSELAVPLMLGKQLLGVINAESKKTDAFLDADERLLVTLAGQISTAIARLRTNKTEQRNTEELSVLYELSQKLTQQLDIDHVLDETYHGVQRLLDTTNFYIALLNPDKPEVTFPINITESKEDLETMLVIDSNVGLTGHILQTKTPVLIKNNAKDWQKNNNVKINGQLPQSWLGVPLLIGNEAIGVMAIQDYWKPNVYDEHDLEILTAIASLSAVAIENTRLFRETEIHANELSVLNELAQTLTQQLDIGRVLNETFQGVLRLLDTHDFYIGLLNSEKTKVTVPLIISSSNEDLKYLEMAPNEGLTGYILQTKKPIMINDHFRTWEKENAVESVGEMPLSWMGVPLLIGSDAIGVLAIQDFKKTNAYDQHDLKIMTAIASQAAIAIENARLFRETEIHANELSILNELAQTLTQQLDVDRVLKETYKGVIRLVDTRDFYIALLNNEKTKVTFPIIISSSEQDLASLVEIEPHEGLTGHILRTKKSVMINENFKAWEKENAVKTVGERPQSWLGVPLLIGKDAIGVLAIQDFNRTNAYDEHDREMLTTIASQAAVTIENSRLFEETQKRLRDQVILRDSAILISSTFNTEKILSKLAEHLCKAIDATSVYICVFDEKMESYTVTAEHLSSIARKEEKVSDLGISYPYSMHEDEMFYERLQHRRHSISHVDDPEISIAEREEMKKYGAMSVLYTPLTAKEQLIGFTEVWESRQKRDFTTEEINLCLLLSQQAASAIENAHLFDKVKQLAALDDMTGLNNRRHFLELAQVELNRSLRYGRSSSIMMLDIDDFKDFNDKYGHAIGDEVLIGVANICKQALRNTDILGRYGGEEFIVLLSETPMEVAKTVAERLRKKVAKGLFATNKGDLNVTVSVGLAENSELTPTLETLIARADQAMYIAKHKGRNQVATSF